MTLHARAIEDDAIANYNGTLHFPSDVLDRRRSKRFCASLAKTLLGALGVATACGDARLPTAPTVLPARSESAANDDGEWGEGDRDDEITMVTYNIYQGTELENSLAAKTPEEFVAGAAKDFTMMQQTNFAERAQAIAREVHNSKPDLIGLQEVALWRTGPTQTPTIPATTVEQDFLAILIDALAAHGDSYVVVSSVTNFDVQGTALLPSGFKDVRLTDANVILARAGKGKGELIISNAQSANFTTNLVVETVGGPVEVLEGWASVDVTRGPLTVRFITTHLDASAPAIRLAQANEVLSGPANTTMRVILAGDLKSSTSSETYGALRSAGLVDVWDSLQAGDAGSTCCEVLPTIDNPAPTLSERIDYVLVRGALEPERIERVGARASTRTRSGLWPSDHAGLVARIGFGERQ